MSEVYLTIEASLLWSSEVVRLPYLCALTKQSLFRSYKRTSEVSIGFSKQAKSGISIFGQVSQHQISY